MQRSTDRILTTHVGSLVRPPAILEIMRAHQMGAAFGPSERETIDQQVTEIVRLQAECGIDIPSDGELSKSSFSAYVHDRLTGFEIRPPAEGRRLFDRGRDRKKFAEAYAEIDGGASTAEGTAVCTGPIAYRGEALVRADLATLKAAAAGLPFSDVFVPAVAPGTVELQRRNEYYKTEDEYLYAIAGAMKTEYRLIVDAGFILQIDDPRLVTEYDSIEPEITSAEYRKFAAVRIEALNHALAGLPQDRIRYHVCWGSWHGPHTTDIGLQEILPEILKIHADAFSIEAANPRHAHEYHVWEMTKLPEGKVLIPGVIAHTTNCVEHPALVADRLLNYARLVGRENVIAGPDCGFAQGFGTQRVHPSIMWEKFRMLAEGARLASRQLWA